MPVLTAKKEGKVPRKVSTFIRLGFDKTGESGDNYYGICPFCSKKKFYLNPETGQYSCKAGDCQREGNQYTLINDWYKDRLEETTEDQLQALSDNRGIPVEALDAAGIAFDDPSYIIPVRGAKGSLVTLRLYQLGRDIMALDGLNTSLWGMEQLTNAKRRNEPVYICEGEWDGIALRYLLQRDKQKGVVVAVPGASTFKREWVEYFSQRNVIYCYDNDNAGLEGTEKAHDFLRGTVADEKRIVWPETVPNGFDVRDFCNAGGDYNTLKQLIEDYESLFDTSSSPEDAASNPVEAFPLLRDGGRPSLEETMKEYDKWLCMTDELRKALRVIYAVVISNQIEGDPLWVHIAAPPSSGKTALITSCNSVGNCIGRSTVTSHSLVSGFMLSGGRDPSLIPQLFGKTFVVKDFTELLKANKAEKDQVYSILRGAYDGSVERSFGNGITRIYRGYFSLISGVTNAIFGESGAVLGERFLIFHMTDVDERKDEDVIMSAISTPASPKEMSDHLQEAAKKFLEYRIEKEDVPQPEKHYLKRIVALSQIVAVMRATLERDFRRERILFRPQPEKGVRIAKQLKKLLQALSMQNEDFQPTEEDYQIVLKVALNTCIGWNLEALQSLTRKDGQTVYQIAEEKGIPVTTLRDQLEDLVFIGVLKKRYVNKSEVPGMSSLGRTVSQYWLSDQIKRLWVEAGLPLGKTSSKPLKAKVKSVSPNGRYP
jgi:hypothetical protein